MGLTRTGDPTARHPLVTVADFKEFANITLDADDLKIEVMLRGVVSHCEWWTNRTFIDDAWQWTMRAWPARVIEIPRAPLRFVESVQYVDIDGNTQSLTEDTDFAVDTDANPGTIEPVYGETWPSVRGETAAAITIKYAAGFGLNAIDVPQELRSAVMMLGTEMYRQPEPTVIGTTATELPWFKGLLRQWRNESRLAY
jgi:uncharacterized phiE125 gp8 family phage protein